MRNMRGWRLWCDVGSIAEAHEEIRDLTKEEAIKKAFEKSKEWPRVLVQQFNSKYPRGATVAGIVYGRISGKLFAEIPET